MNVFMYCAALYCEDCGRSIREDLTAKGKAPNDPEDESSYDSDEFPKGPYGDGGGEADSPQHCDSCGVFLNNSLTADGESYVREAFREFDEKGSGAPDVIAEWKAAYDWLVPDTDSD